MALCLPLEKGQRPAPPPSSGALSAPREAPRWRAEPLAGRECLTEGMGTAGGEGAHPPSPPTSPPSRPLTPRPALAWVPLMGPSFPQRGGQAYGLVSSHPRAIPPSHPCTFSPVGDQRRGHLPPPPKGRTQHREVNEGVPPSPPPEWMGYHRPRSACTTYDRRGPQTEVCVRHL